MEDQYKFISYIAAKSRINELKEYCIDTYGHRGARSKAIKKVMDWKKASTLKRKYQGISLTLIYRIDGDCEHAFFVQILTGTRMHTSAIVQALADEATALDCQNYSYEPATLQHDGAHCTILNDKHLGLYYFTT